MLSNDSDFGCDGEIYLDTRDRLIALQPDRWKIFHKKKDGVLKMDRELSESDDNGKHINVEDEFVVIDGVKLPVRKGNPRYKYLIG